ncbi:MAG: pilin [Candidatus Nomurabacteria bacterium]|jgi:hypothetical protein|nr:pilin [Candidatus Nomurabacteria bacterium]
MTKKFTAIMSSLVLALLLIFPASALVIGDNTGVNVDIDKKVDSIYCDYSDSSKAIVAIADTEYTSYKAIYISSGDVNATWCKAKIKAIADKLVSAGLANSFSESSIYDDHMHKSVELLNLQSGNSSGGGNTSSPSDPTDPSAGFGEANSTCTSILPSSWCGPDNDGVVEILSLVLNIMTMGMGILATIGIVISGIQWLTARDKEDQVVKAKSRIFNIVIGIAVWGIMWLLLSWLLPSGINLNITTP